ncbi:MAG: BREX-1 system phosphatase PglZ type A, partial [Wenzhouxiangellaceae bacterium]
CAGADPRLDSVLEHLFQELAEDRTEKARLIERCGLAPILWAQLKQQFGYQSDTPGLKDFVLELFKSCYAMGTDGDIRLHEEALVLLRRWKDNRRFGQAFASLSHECAEALNIEQDLIERDFRELVELDYFRLIDQKIISDLVREIAGRTVKADDVVDWVRHRRQSHWYGDFAHLYRALEYAARFVQLMGELDLNMNSLAGGFERYTQSWFRLDQFYRKFVFHTRSSGEATLVGPLAEQMENFYGNNFLYQVNERWQTLADRAERWEIEDVVPQRKFYKRWVQPFLDREHRVCVIISDALRFEIGEELLGRIRREDRYSAELSSMLGQLPSYTQLGMAALLPHESLAIAPKKGAGVLIDGQSTQGSDRRNKILQAALDGQGIALTAETVDGMHRDELRERIKANRVIYVYHNRIDHTGDKIQSEGRAFEAAE